MTTILDDQLYSHSDRLAGKVVLITGEFSSLACPPVPRDWRVCQVQVRCLLSEVNQPPHPRSACRAKLVLGDINESTAQSVAAQIKDDGGEAIGLRCDVTSWEDQLNLFQTAFDAFGPADVVVANAGINETGDYTTPKVKDGKLEKPTMTTIDVNLMGTAYTTHLATHFLQLDRKQDNVLKSIVVLGSMASWKPAATGPMYSATKCGVLGMTRSLAYPLEQKNIRVAVVHPFFTDTALLDTTNRVLAAGLAFVPIERVGGTIILAATDRDMSTTGAAWVLPDGGPLLRLESEAIKGGVYDILTNRAMQFEANVSRLKVVASLWAVFRSKVSLTMMAVPAAVILSLVYTSTRL